MNKIVLVGAGGHAKVVANIIRDNGAYIIAGAVDPWPRGRGARLSGLRILGDDSILNGLLKSGVTAATVGVGSVGDTSTRRRIYERLKDLGFELPVLAHVHSIAAHPSRIYAGAQIMAGVVINPGVTVGENAVINTGAIIEHDVRVGAHAFVGPGARVGGEVIIGTGAFIGIGATIKQGVRIGARSLVGAGAVVIRDVPAGKTVFGVPASVARR